MTTLYTAKKYAVPALESQCVDFLKRNLNAENAFMLLSQARLFDEQQLADLCLETIDKNTTEAISAEGFVDIDLQTLSSVLKRDTLSIRECKLFQAIVRWADAECQRQQIASSAENKRRVLGKPPPPYYTPCFNPNIFGRFLFFAILRKIRLKNFQSLIYQQSRVPEK